MHSATSSTPSLQSPTSFAAMPRAAAGVIKLLTKLPHGMLDLRLPDGSCHQFGHDDPLHPKQPAERAILHITDWQVFGRTLKSGDIGFAESFMDGQWSTPDLPALLNLLVRNRTHMESAVYGSWWGAVAYRIKHWLNRNSRQGSAKNIHAHYDLGNDFYRLWLDPTMSYSSAWFEGNTAQSMPSAQHAKITRALREVDVRPGSRVLEVGCGWGGLAEVAARDFGAHVTGVTLSREQLDWAQTRMARAGLEGQSDLRYQDYRDLAPATTAQQDTPETFDAIVSIEMFEAVGREYWDSYFAMLRRCLKPGGKACIQSITIRDDLFERYVRSTDFIQQYIFPGGLLPSPSVFEAEAKKAGLVVTNRLAFGQDYAETLRRWRADFQRQEQAVRKQGFDTRFIRTWEFYLAYCEAAFVQGNTDVMQFTLCRAEDC